ncbi:MAG TPA: NADH-quinone oxidoreductase subunit J [Solirubrobacteraceae bacterium]|jgi:NADH:ubiquinone oxidoreductase subunit 6 (subunit J)
MSQVLFFLAGFGAIAGAVGVVMLRDPFFAVLALVAHLLSLAILFLLLRAEFVAAVQVVVYAGAVMVLYVFVVAYVGGREEPIGELLRGRGPAGAQLRLGAAILGGALLVELLIALLGTGLKAVGSDGAPYAPGPKAFGTPAYIGQLLLTRFLLVFEVASLLLLIAAVGAVVLARRRGGIDEDGEGTPRVLTPLDLIRPRETGTMAEGVGGVPFAIARARGRSEVYEAAPDGRSADESASAGEPVAAAAGTEATERKDGW